jgi:hypothetical protein
MKVNDKFYLPCWHGAQRVYHPVRVSYVNPDGTVTVQGEHGRIWFGVARKDLVTEVPSQ